MNPSTAIRRLSANFQVAKQEIFLQELQIITAMKPSVTAGAKSEASSYTITWSIGFDQKLDLLVREKPDGAQFHWAGTLTEPRGSVRLSGLTTANATQVSK